MPVARERVRQQIGERLQEHWRALVRGGDPVEVGVVAVEVVVDERRGTGGRSQLFGERRGVEIVHLERRAAPRASLVVAPATVRRHQDERVRAR